MGRVNRSRFVADTCLKPCHGVEETMSITLTIYASLGERLGLGGGYSWGEQPFAPAMPHVIGSIVGLTGQS